MIVNRILFDYDIVLSGWETVPRELSILFGNRIGCCIECRVVDRHTLSRRKGNQARSVGGYSDFPVKFAVFVFPFARYLSVSRLNRSFGPL